MALYVTVSVSPAACEKVKEICAPALKPAGQVNVMDVDPNTELVQECPPLSGPALPAVITGVGVTAGGAGPPCGNPTVKVPLGATAVVALKKHASPTLLAVALQG